MFRDNAARPASPPDAPPRRRRARWRGRAPHAGKRPGTSRFVQKRAEGFNDQLRLKCASASGPSRGFEDGFENALLEAREKPLAALWCSRAVASALFVRCRASSASNASYGAAAKRTRPSAYAYARTPRARLGVLPTSARDVRRASASAVPSRSRARTRAGPLCARTRARAAGRTAVRRDSHLHPRRRLSFRRRRVSAFRRSHPRLGSDVGATRDFASPRTRFRTAGGVRAHRDAPPLAAHGPLHDPADRSLPKSRDDSIRSRSLNFFFKETVFVSSASASASASSAAASARANASASAGSKNPAGAAASPPGVERRLRTSLCLCVMATELGKWFTNAPSGRPSYSAPVVKLCAQRTAHRDASAARRIIRCSRVSASREREGSAPSCCWALCVTYPSGGTIELFGGTRDGGVRVEETTCVAERARACSFPGQAHSPRQTPTPFHHRRAGLGHHRGRDEHRTRRFGFRGSCGRGIRPIARKRPLRVLCHHSRARRGVLLRRVGTRTKKAIKARCGELELSCRFLGTRFGKRRSHDRALSAHASGSVSAPRMSSALRLFRAAPGGAPRCPRARASRGDPEPGSPCPEPRRGWRRLFAT